MNGHCGQHVTNSVRRKVCEVPSCPGIGLLAQDRLAVVLEGEKSPFLGEGFYGFHLGGLQLMQTAYEEPIERKGSVSDPKLSLAVGSYQLRAALTVFL